MSFLDKITDNVFNEAENILGDGPSLVGGLLDSKSTRIIDFMRSLPGASELQSLGFPQFDDSFSDVGQHAHGQFQSTADRQWHGDIFKRIMSTNEHMSDLCGRDGNPLDSVLGGREGFEITLRSATDLVSGTPDALLERILGKKSDGGGGRFGSIFSGIEGILGGDGGSEGGDGLFGGILGGLGGLTGGKGSPLGGLLNTLLPIAMKVVPLLLL